MNIREQLSEDLGCQGLSCDGADMIARVQTAGGQVAVDGKGPTIGQIAGLCQIGVGDTIADGGVMNIAIIQVVVQRVGVPIIQSLARKHAREDGLIEFTVEGLGTGQDCLEFGAFKVRVSRIDPGGTAEISGEPDVARVQRVDGIDLRILIATERVLDHRLVRQLCIRNDARAVGYAQWRVEALHEGLGRRQQIVRVWRHGKDLGIVDIVGGDAVDDMVALGRSNVSISKEGASRVQLLRSQLRLRVINVSGGSDMPHQFQGAN